MTVRPEGSACFLGFPGPPGTTGQAPQVKSRQRVGRQVPRPPLNHGPGVPAGRPPSPARPAQRASQRLSPALLAAAYAPGRCLRVTEVPLLTMTAG